MRYRIFIHIHYMALGGAERSLLGLLNALDPELVEIDLMINQHTGEFMPIIPKKVNLLPELRGYNAIERPIREILREGQIGITAGRLYAKWRHRFYKKKITSQDKYLDESIFQYIANAVQPFLPSLKELGEYDLAISFLQPHNIVLNKVNARKKVAWIHTDYSSVHVNTQLELPIWDGFDHIASISPECTRSFLKAFPSLKEKIIEIENILSPSLVKLQAKERTTLSPKFSAHLFNHSDATTLLSVGRISYAKNYDNVPEIAKKLKEMGIQFKWFIVGPGDHSHIDSLISKTNTGDCIEFLGATSNPYPYIRACDIYVQPSRFEGKSVTVREAQILGKPVLITNYPTAPSQVTHGVDGIICPMDNDSIAKALAKLICSPEVRQHLSEYLSTHDYGNEIEVRKIYALLN